jgi:MFS family permease
MTTPPLEQSLNCAGPRRSVGSRRHRRGFWVVAFAFLAVMALGTVPSPLDGLYRARDHFSLFMVTVAFAVYAIGVIGALLLGGHLSDLYGRRRLLLPSIGVATLCERVRAAMRPAASTSAPPGG